MRIMLNIAWGDAAAVAGPWAITFGLFVSMFVAVQKGWLVPGKAHLREIGSREALIKSLRDDRITEIATIRAEHVADLAAEREEHVTELTMIRERHDRYMKAMDENHARETEGTRRDSADWRTAYHLAAEVGKVQAAQLDELVEGYRLILALVQALPKVQSNPQSDSPEVNDRAGRGLPKR